MAAIQESSYAPRNLQKYPATYQCRICPKRFTRAFNLRSHMRTHENRRPFVCNTCGKDFTRQHDRKIHEATHVAAKFVCKGELKNGQWGCGRRFNRASNFGRHFRSAIGKVCIRPLLVEEAEKRRLDAASASENQLGARMVQFIPNTSNNHDSAVYNTTHDLVEQLDGEFIVENFPKLSWLIHTPRPFAPAPRLGFCPCSSPYCQHSRVTSNKSETHQRFARKGYVGTLLLYLLHV
jgi:hypothetical protein